MFMERVWAFLETTNSPKLMIETSNPNEKELEVGRQMGIINPIYDFSIKIEEEYYSFPMTYEDLISYGWTLDPEEDSEEWVPVNRYGHVKFYRDEDEIQVLLLNQKINAVLKKQCVVAGIYINRKKLKLNGKESLETKIRLPRGVLLGQATTREIKNAYGEPEEEYVATYYKRYRYKRAVYQQVDLYVDIETGTLEAFYLRNFTEMDDFDKGRVSEEIPRNVVAYKVPEHMEDDLLGSVLEYGGDLYRLPAPVSAFLKNGWKVEAQTAPYVEGNTMTSIFMKKDDVKVKMQVFNYEENAAWIENCFITTLSTLVYDKRITLRLAGNYSIGAKKQDLLKAAQEKGYICKTVQDRLFIYPKNKKDKHWINIWFDEEEDPNAAASIAYRNRQLWG